MTAGRAKWERLRDAREALEVEKHEVDLFQHLGSHRTKLIDVAEAANASGLGGN